MSTIYGIVKQNDGHISINSELNKGTTFKIYLPRHEGTSKKKIEEAILEPAIQGVENILVVEDEQALLKTTLTILQDQGYTVYGASSPEEAIRLSKSLAGKIQMLITDLIMPGMNGRKLSNMLASSHPDMRCLYMSGYTAEIISSRELLGPEIHFLQKPFSRQDLLNTVRKVLDAEPGKC